MSEILIIIVFHNDFTHKKPNSMNTLQLVSSTKVNGAASVKTFLFSDAALLPSPRFVDTSGTYNNLIISAQKTDITRKRKEVFAKTSDFIKKYICEFFYLSGVTKVSGLNYSSPDNTSGIFYCAASKFQYAEQNTTTAEVRATFTLTVTGGTASAGTNKLTAYTINGVSLISAAVDWVTSNNATATAIAANITANAASNGGYTAAAVGAVVTTTAPVGSGATPNSQTVARTNGGNFTSTITQASGGVSFVGTAVFHFAEPTEDGVVVSKSYSVPNKTIIQVIELASLNSPLVAIATSSITTSFTSLVAVTGV